MIGRRHIGLIAGAATLLAAMPLSTIFLQWTWFVQCFVVVLFVAGAATLARSLRGPAWTQFVAMLGAYLAILTFLTPDNRAILGIIPTADTFLRFGELLRQAGDATQSMGVPVSDHDGLLFLTSMGVGAVAICVDLCAVALRRPALAGLPMLAIYSVPVAVHQNSVSVIPFLAGAAGFLWLLVSDNVDRVRRFGRRFTGDGRDIDVWEPSPLAAAGRRLAVVGLLVAVIVPLAVPGMTTGMLDRFGSGIDGTGGDRPGGRTVSLVAMLDGRLKQDEETELVRVTTTDSKPGYLRFGVADELSVEGFRNRTPTGRQTASNLPDPREKSRSGVIYQEGRASVEILNLSLTLLPVFSEPLNVTRGIDARWFFDPRMQVIYSSTATTVNKKYEFSFVRSDFSADVLRRAPSLPANNELRRQNTAVPAGVRTVEDKVAELIQGKTTDYDKVRALSDFFSSKNNFTYSLEVPSETGGPAIVNFLTERKGFCVQYAAALSWMVREAGVPARVAFGFAGGVKSDTGGTYSLTNRNLHAWTEVYFDGYGWVPFDATPSSYIEGSIDPEWAPNPDGPVGGSTDDGLTPGPGNPNEPGAGDLSKGEDPLNAGELGGDIGGATKAPPRWPGYLGMGALAAVLLLSLPALRRALMRRQRRPRTAGGGPDLAVSGSAAGEPYVVADGGPEAAQARHDAHAAWDELIDTLVDYRLLVDLAETPRTTAARVVRDTSLRDAAARGAHLLGQVEERARYARDPLLTGELGSSLRAVRRALAVRAPRRIRLAAVLLPPSVLQRWRSRTLAAATTAAATTARLHETLSPRRLLPRRS